MKIPLISLAILLTVFSLGSSQQWYQRNNPHLINEADYQRLVVNPETRNHGVTVLKFFTPWCRYCKYLKDIIDDLKAKERWEITVYEVNCDGVNYHFCGRMNVHSYPKMIVFENGQAVESMDGFYPYQVVRELFVKYNRTAHHKVEEVKVHEKVEAKEAHQEKAKEEHKEEDNFVEPEVVAPEVKHEDKKHKQKHHRKEGKEEKQEVPLHHAEPEHKRSSKKHKSEHSGQQPAKQEKHHHKKESKKEKAKEAEPVHEKEEHHKSKQQHHQPSPSPSVPPQKEQHHATPPPSQTQQPQQPVISAPSVTSKKPQQMIEQQENIAIVDQNIKETQKQKKLAEDVQKGNIDTIDLTKILPSQDHAQYGKYIIYGICLIVGGYYFMHIMKANPGAESAKPHLAQSGAEKKSSQPKIRTNISIEDSELREELHFNHLNEQQVNLNSVQIRDEDL